VVLFDVPTQWSSFILLPNISRVNNGVLNMKEIPKPIQELKLTGHNLRTLANDNRKLGHKEHWLKEMKVRKIKN
jgi:hypothetical protein